VRQRAYRNREQLTHINFSSFALVESTLIASNRAMIRDRQVSWHNFSGAAKDHGRPHSNHDQACGDVVTNAGGTPSSSDGFAKAKLIASDLHVCTFLKTGGSEWGSNPPVTG
jgi:hypothetical protein